MRKRMLSLILVAVMVCTMMIPAVSAAEVSIVPSTETEKLPSSRSAVRSDGATARTELIRGYNYDYDNLNNPNNAYNTIEVTNRIHSLQDQGNMFVVGVYTQASREIKTAESVSVKVYADSETLDYETFYSNNNTGYEFQAVLRDQDGSEANRATATFILRFDEVNFPPFSRRLEITFDYSNGR